MVLTAAVALNSVPIRSASGSALLSAVTARLHRYRFVKVASTKTLPVMQCRSIRCWVSACCTVCAKSGWLGVSGSPLDCLSRRDSRQIFLEDVSQTARVTYNV